MGPLARRVVFRYFLVLWHVHAVWYWPARLHLWNRCTDLPWPALRKELILLFWLSKPLLFDVFDHLLMKLESSLFLAERYWPAYVLMDRLVRI